MEYKFHSCKIDNYISKVLNHSNSELVNPGVLTPEDLRKNLRVGSNRLISDDMEIKSSFNPKSKEIDFSISGQDVGFKHKQLCTQMLDDAVQYCIVEDCKGDISKKFKSFDPALKPLLESWNAHVTIKSAYNAINDLEKEGMFDVSEGLIRAYEEQVSGMDNKFVLENGYLVYSVSENLVKRYYNAAKSNIFKIDTPILEAELRNVESFISSFKHVRNLSTDNIMVESVMGGLRDLLQNEIDYRTTSKFYVAESFKDDLLNNATTIVTENIYVKPENDKYEIFFENSIRNYGDNNMNSFVTSVAPLVLRSKSNVQISGLIESCMKNTSKSEILKSAFLLENDNKVANDENLTRTIESMIQEVELWKTKALVIQENAMLTNVELQEVVTTEALIQMCKIEELDDNATVEEILPLVEGFTKNLQLLEVMEEGTRGKTVINSKTFKAGVGFKSKADKISAGARNAKDKADRAKAPMNKGIEMLKKAAMYPLEKILQMDKAERTKRVIEGRSFRGKMLSLVKKLIISGGIGLLTGGAGIVLGILAFIAQCAMDQGLDSRIRNQIVRELETELAVVTEKVEDSKNESDRKEKYALMRIKSQLENDIKRIKYNMRSDYVKGGITTKPVKESASVASFKQVSNDFYKM